METTEQTSNRYKRGQKNKEKIKSITLHLMNEKGYGSTTIRDICEALEITAPSFYYYFSSKEILYRTLLEESIEIIEGNLEEKLKDSTETTFSHRLTILVDSLLDLYKDHPEEGVFYLKNRFFPETLVKESIQQRMESSEKRLEAMATAFLKTSAPETIPKETLPSFLTALDLYISGAWLRYHRDGVEAAEKKVRKSWRAIQLMSE